MLYPRSALALLCGLLAVAAAADMTFHQFVRKFNKPYKQGSAEWREREATFLRNVREIAEHNRRYDLKQVPYFREINQFTDMELGHLRATLGHAGASHALAAKPTRIHRAGEVKDVPEYVNWVEAGVTTPVKNQGHCGSCWAFSTTAMIESHLAINDGVLTELSVEQLVDCVENPNECGGEGGCYGATVNLALDYLMEAGQLHEWAYPYTQYWNSRTGATYECQYDKLVGYDKKVLTARVEGYVKVENNSYDALLEAVTHGPVAVSVDASSWHSYGGGVFDGCSKESVTINHGVQLVGYGTDEETGLDYWLIRNSWGPYWGEDGYIRLRRYNPHKGETVPCAWDYDPAAGTECKGGADKLWVCGNCGILWDSSYPLGVHRV